MSNRFTAYTNIALLIETPSVQELCITGKKGSREKGRKVKWGKKQVDEVWR